MALYAAFTLLLSLTAAEVALRVFMGNNAIARMLIYRPEGPYCVALRPNVSMIHTGLFRRIPPVRMSVNRYGYRGPARPPEKPAGAYRVIVIGDSFTFCPGVEDGADYPARLEQRLLPTHPGVEVLNFGVPAHNLDEYALHLASEGAAFHPDLVILQVAGNDYGPSMCAELQHMDALLRRWMPSYVVRVGLIADYLLEERRYDLSCSQREKRFDGFVDRVQELQRAGGYDLRIVAFGEPVECGGYYVPRVLRARGIPYLPFPETLHSHLTVDIGHLDRDGCDLYARRLAAWLGEDALSAARGPR